MAIINLRDLYPFYENDELTEVPDEVLAAIEDAERQEENFVRRRYYNKAHYSLDAGGGIENCATFHSPSACELFERRMENEKLYSVLASLPEKQGRRIYAHYILGLSQIEIAKAEGVNVRNVRKSIDGGLRSLKNILINFR